MWKVKNKGTKIIYAMKEVSKVKAYKKNSLTFVSEERKILMNLDFPFLANLRFSFQDNENLYLILDYFEGGDLRYYLNKKKKFSEIQIKFIIANILITLKYLHSKNIIHRDLKPENLVFDKNGYVYLLDFGVAKKITKGKFIVDSSGTPGYCSPEILLNKNQNFCVDFYSLGVITFELIYGKRPYNGKTKKEIINELINNEIKINSNFIPKNFNESIGDFINKLLKRKCEERIGHNNIEEILNHPWLKDIDWKNIENKTYKEVPFIPKSYDNYDTKSSKSSSELKIDNYDFLLKKVNEYNFLKNFNYNYYYEKNKENLNNNLNNNQEKFKSIVSLHNKNQIDLQDNSCTMKYSFSISEDGINTIKIPNESKINCSFANV